MNPLFCLGLCVFSLLLSCRQSNSQDSIAVPQTVQKDVAEFLDAPYLAYFHDRGNQILDTIRVGGELIDPIDDTLNFEKAAFGFYVDIKEKVYKKTKIHESVNGRHVIVEYFRDVSDCVDLSTYREIDGDRYFASGGQVFFWWANSGGDFALGVDGADAETFRPADSFCGGYDKYGILYGSPNWGVYRLNIDDFENVKLVPKEGSYWNTPQHYLISGEKVYDVMFNSRAEDRYYCELNTEVSAAEVEEMLSE